MGKWLALWKYFKRATEVKTPLPSRSLFQAIFSCRVANKEVQRVIDTVTLANDGTQWTLYLLGARTSNYFARKGCKLADSYMRC